MEVAGFSSLVILIACSPFRQTVRSRASSSVKPIFITILSVLFGLPHFLGSFLLKTNASFMKPLSFLLRLWPNFFIVFAINGKELLWQAGRRYTFEKGELFFDTVFWFRSGQSQKISTPVLIHRLKMRLRFRSCISLKFIIVLRSGLEKTLTKLS